VDNPGWRKNLVSVFLYIGTTLLIVNQRIGYTDNVGLNPLALALRVDVWFVTALFFGLIFTPGIVLWPTGDDRLPKTVLVLMPLAVLSSGVLASVVSEISCGKGYDLLGAFDFAKSIICIGLGILIFNLSITNREFSSKLIYLIIFSSFLNVLAGVFTSVTSINNIAGFNAETAGEIDVGLGFVGYGNRFQGLGSNPNILMTQALISLSFLVPEICQSFSKARILRAIFLLTYSASLIIIILWTGVRAALFLMPVICLITIWLRKKPGLKNQIRSIAVIVAMLIILFGVWSFAAMLGLTETMLERVTGAEDGRLNIWSYYSGLLFQNPLGFGYGFESIVDTHFGIVEWQRLPPHNSLLQAGMYGGFSAVIISMILLGKIVRFFGRYRRLIKLQVLPTQLEGAYIAWWVVVVNSLFGGLLSADFNFSILTAILLALASREWVKARRQVVDANV